MNPPLLGRQGKSGAIPPLFRGFVLSLCEDQQSQATPVDVLRLCVRVRTRGCASL